MMLDEGDNDELNNCCVKMTILQLKNKTLRYFKKPTTQNFKKNNFL